MKRLLTLPLFMALFGFWSCQNPQTLNPSTRASLASSPPDTLAVNVPPAFYSATRTVTPPSSDPLYETKQSPLVSVSIKQKSKGTADLHFRLYKSQIEAPFQLKAIDTSVLNAVKVEVRGIGILTPLWGQGADANGLISHTGQSINLIVPDVPLGTARLATVQFYDNATPVAGTLLKGVFDVSGSSSSVELSFRTTPTAQVIEDLLAGDTSQKHLASQIDLSQLQSFIDAISGLSGTSPTYTYVTHPSLVKTSAIAADLLNHNGVITHLNAASTDYKESPSGVQFSISGLAGGRLATVQITDPSSQVISNLSNGGVFNLPQITPGNWQVQLTADDHLPLTVNLNALAGQTHDLGTLNVLTTLPQIQNLSSPHGNIGSSLTLNGINFGSTISENTVNFGSTPATLVSASTNQLIVTVPPGIYGTKDITVTAHGKTSNSQAFEVTPTLSQWVPSAHYPGEEVVIQGTGFSPTPGENTVTLGGQSATISESTTTAITLTVPNTLYGVVPTEVKVGYQTSTAINFSVRPKINSISANSGIIGENVEISGLGFHPTQTNNQVLLNGEICTVTSGNSSQLTITLPQAPSGSLIVQTGSQASNAVTFNILPTVDLTTPSENSNVSGLVTLETHHSSGNPVQKVEFFLDSNTLLNTDTTLPYEFTWDASGASLGPHTLKARITDTEGNIADSTVKNIQVVQANLSIPAANISFGPSENPELIHHFEIEGPGGSAGPIMVNPYNRGSSEMSIKAYDYKNQALTLSKADFIWSFTTTTPYPGNIRYPYNNDLHKGLYNNGIRKGNATLRVESLSTGLTKTFQVQAIDVPPRITAFSVSPEPISNCTSPLPSETDIVCQITIQGNKRYDFMVTFNDGNEDIIVTENTSNASRGVAYENQYYSGGNPPYQSVPQPGNAYNVYYTGFPDYNINPLVTSYGYAVDGPSSANIHTKTYNTSLETRNADNGGGLRIKASTATGQVRQIFWEITVQ